MENNNTQCSVCKRSNLQLREYSFKQPKHIVDWQTNEILRENPNYLTVVLCGTDMHLVGRIKRQSSRLTPKQILDKAIIYRNERPIKPIR
jgi:hypothetical protein